MRKILNYFTGSIITFLFLIFNDLDAIPSKYCLGIAAVIFIFDAIEVRKGNRVFKAPSLRKTKKCTSAELRKLKIEMCKNPDGFVRRMTGQTLQGYDANGKPLVYRPKTALFLED